MFLFYDYESFGKNPALDRPAQFGGVITDNKFNIISKPHSFFCHLPSDYLPNPESILIHGITPQDTINYGITEKRFTKKIYNLFHKSDTCILGFNNIKFDDEITRYLFYRNFYDPYSWSWQLGNSRWDLLNVIRAYYALRPEGIQWPIYDNNNLPDFRLSSLSKANNIYHVNIHNAISDVYACISLAKLMNTVQPQLFNFLYNYRNKKQLRTLIDIINIKPLIYIDSTVGAKNNNITYIVPLIWHPYNKNAVITCNLNSQYFYKIKNLNKYKSYIDLSIDQNKKTKNYLTPIITIHLNKCPIITPINILRKQDIKRLNIDKKFCQNNLVWLRKNQKIKEKLNLLFSYQIYQKSSFIDVDQQLYNGFFNYTDQKLMNTIRNSQPKNINKIIIDNTKDKRIKELLFRYRARNFPNLLNKIEKLQWLKHCQSRFTNIYFQKYIDNLKQLNKIYVQDNKKKILLISIYNYIKKYRNILYNL